MYVFYTYEANFKDLNRPCIQGQGLAARWGIFNVGPNVTGRENYCLSKAKQPIF
jgi:hypothetical protein